MPKLTQEEFLAKARAVHGEKYDYSQVHYIQAHAKVKIGCALHGEFEQTPNAHARGAGCPQCATTFALDTASFVERARQVHGDKYDYSQARYTTARAKVGVACSTHGLFWQSATEHLSGSGCRKCGGTAPLTTSDFIERSRKYHGNKYDYSLTNYTYSTEKVTIICPVHGAYQQPASTHMRGAGCFLCARMENPWRATNWVALQKGRVPLLYIVRLSKGEESFFKVGITLQRLDKRFKPSVMPYKVEPLAVFTSQDALYIHQAETAIKKQFRSFRYSPALAFGGQTECYSAIECILEFLTTQDIIRRV